jgi:predicted transcriptional regulator
VTKQKSDPVLSELEMIRKLLVLALLRTGITQAQMGGVLGLSQSQISTMFPSGALAALSGKAKKQKPSAAAVEGAIDGGD